MSYNDAYNNLVQGLEGYFDYLNQINQPVIVNDDSATQVDSDEEPTYLAIFMYVISDLFNKAQMYSSYKGKHVPSNQDGTGNQLDKIALTQDDSEIFTDFLKAGAKYVFNNALSKYAKNVTSAFLFDEGLTIVDYNNLTQYKTGDYIYYGANKDIYQAIQDCIGLAPDAVNGTEYWIPVQWYYDTKGKVVYMIEWDTDLNPNMVSEIEANVQMALIWYVLKEWYKLIGLFDEAKIKEYEFQSIINEILTSFTNFTTPLVRPNRWL